MAVAEARAKADLEGGEHPRERPAGGAQHDAEARRDEAHAGGGGRRGRRLPGAADVGEVAVTELRELGESLAAARPVRAHGGRRDQHPRRRLHLLQRGDQRGRGLHAAVENGFLARRGPQRRDGRAAEIHDGVHAGEVDRIEASGRRVPRHFARSGRSPTDEPHDLVSGGGEIDGQAGADQPAAPLIATLSRGRSGPHGVALEVGAGALVPEPEEALEHLAHGAAGKGSGHSAGWQTVLNVIEELAGALLRPGLKAMRVLPCGERSLDLTVDELPALHVPAHLGDPARADRPHIGLEDHAPAVLHAPLLLQHAELLPRGCQALERAGAGVVGEELVNGHRHGAAPLEDRHECLHQSLPGFYPAAPWVSRLCATCACKRRRTGDERPQRRGPQHHRGGHAP